MMMRPGPLVVVMMTVAAIRLAERKIVRSGRGLGGIDG